MTFLRDLPSQERVLELLQTMCLIREFEDQAGQALASGHVRGSEESRLLRPGIHGSVLLGKLSTVRM